jgi:dihydrofolate reductase
MGVLERERQRELRRVLILRDPLQLGGIPRRQQRAATQRLDHTRGLEPKPVRDFDTVVAVLSEQIPFTGLLNGVPKYVASRTLAGPLAWEGSTLVAGDFAESITALKERHVEVHVIGSLDLVQSLLRLGLVDRMNLWLYPLLLGSGKQVFAGGTVPMALRLTESVTYPNGTLQLAYETVGVPTYGNMAIE